MLRAILPAFLFSPETPVQAPVQTPAQIPAAVTEEAKVADNELDYIKVEQDEEAQDKKAAEEAKKAAEEKAAQDKAETERLLTLGKRYETDIAALKTEANAQLLAAELKAKHENETIKDVLTKELNATKKLLAKEQATNKGLIDSSAGFIEEIESLQPALKKAQEELAYTRNSLMAAHSNNVELAEGNKLLQAELLTTRRQLHEKTTKIKSLTQDVTHLTEQKENQGKFITGLSSDLTVANTRAGKAEAREAKAKEFLIKTSKEVDVLKAEVEDLKSRLRDKDDTISNPHTLFARTSITVPAVRRIMRLGR